MMLTPNLTTKTSLTMKTKPFHNHALNHRLGIALLLQPQMRKVERQTPVWYDAAIMLTAFAVVGGALLIYLKQPN